MHPVLHIVLERVVLHKCLAFSSPASTALIHHSYTLMQNCNYSKVNESRRIYILPLMNQPRLNQSFENEPQRHWFFHKKCIYQCAHIVIPRWLPLFALFFLIHSNLYSICPIVCHTLTFRYSANIFIGVLKLFKQTIRRKRWNLIHTLTTAVSIDSLIHSKCPKQLLKVTIYQIHF